MRAGAAVLGSGAPGVEAVESAMGEYLERWKGIDVEYMRLVDPENFLAPSDFDRELLLVGAVRIGRTRLIDNIRIERPSPGGRRESN